MYTFVNSDGVVVKSIDFSGVLEEDEDFVDEELVSG